MSRLQTEDDNMNMPTGMRKHAAIVDIFVSAVTVLLPPVISCEVRLNGLLDYGHY